MVFGRITFSGTPDELIAAQGGMPSAKDRTRELERAYVSHVDADVSA